MKNYIMCFLFLLLCSCSTIKAIVEPTERIPLDLPSAEPLTLKDVKFIVIHKDNASKVFSDLEKKGIDPVVFALSGDDYKALATNVADIKGYIKVQNKIIILYKKYYESK